MNASNNDYRVGFLFEKLRIFGYRQGTLEGHTNRSRDLRNRKTPLRAARNHFWLSRRSFQTTPHSSMQSNSFRKNPPEICHVRNLFLSSSLTSLHRSNPLGAVQLCSERLMESQMRVSSFRARTRLKSDMSGASFRVLFWPRSTARTRSEPFNCALNGSWQLRGA